MSTFTIFAGVNGAGKSTLYRYESQKTGNDLGVRICPDELLVQAGGDWKNNRDVARSGVETIDKIEYCLKNKLSFNWETTLFGGLSIKYIQMAKELGYKVKVNFVSTSSVEKNLKRIKQRVKKGGHGIEESLVRMRFSHQFANLSKVMKLVDGVLFYNNDDSMKLVGVCLDKKLAYYDTKTDWVKKIFFPPCLPTTVNGKNWNL